MMSLVAQDTELRVGRDHVGTLSSFSDFGFYAK